jgi:hypothetical protein
VILHSSRERKKEVKFFLSENNESTFSILNNYNIQDETSFIKSELKVQRWYRFFTLEAGLLSITSDILKAFLINTKKFLKINIQT